MKRTDRSAPFGRRRSLALEVFSLESRALLSHSAFEITNGMVRHAEIGAVHPASLIARPETAVGALEHAPHFDKTRNRHHGRGPGGGTGSGGGSNPVQLASAPYRPALIRQAYGFNQLSQTGAGQTIAIVDAYDDPTIVSDLHKFDQTYGLPDPTLTKVMPTGTASYNAGWAMEIALDVEWAHAVAPGANIMLVEANSASYSSLLAGVDYATTHGANQISMSWGGGEWSSESASDSHFNHPGISYFASSGDSGFGASYPAGSPYVTAVGGTTLTLDTSGNRVNETAWSGSGGGNSSYESRPKFQNGFSTKSARGIPDVSYLADPNTGVSLYISAPGYGGWYQVGGTSAGAPQWAGLMALVNQGRASAGKAPIGTGLAFGTNSALYALAGGSSYNNSAGNYFDVTAGNDGGANASTGYDFVTGLGSPVANKLVPALINS